MAIDKIILFYGFTPVKDPDAVHLWQKTLCRFLGLKGRIIVSPHGINVTLGGEVHNLKKYVKETKAYPGLRKIDVKWSDGSAEDFPRLSVKVRDELVAFGAPEELRVAKGHVVGGGKHLKPEQVHKLVDDKKAVGEEVIFFDGRNAFEAKIGKFKNAVVPDVNTTHDFIRELESGKYDELKDKPIVTYCTGGIRCEVLSSLMINRGFSEVYQIDGGIVRYGETFGDDGLWEGSLYIFDRRKNVNFTPKAKTIGSCERCGAATSNFENCGNNSCRKLRLICENCLKNTENIRCPGGCAPTSAPKKDRLSSALGVK